MTTTIEHANEIEQILDVLDMNVTPTVAAKLDAILEDIRYRAHCAGYDAAASERGHKR